MGTVLIVDDEADISFVLRLLVGELGHTVFTAANGKQALALAREHRPDLIVSDWMMPQMDGITLFREIQCAPGLETTPLVLMTAAAEPPTIAVEVLRKPFPIDHLFGIVERYC